MSHFFSEIFLSLFSFALFISFFIFLYGMISYSKKGSSSRVSFVDMSKTSSENVNSFLKLYTDKISINRNKDKKNDVDVKKEIKKSKVFVVDFDGSVDAKTETGFMEEMNAVIDTFSPGDKLFIRLKSGGGYVHSYGLASDKISYAKSLGLEVIVSVDEIAASGGYMMASVANKIIASPFSIIGSIGVVSGQMNFYEFMKNNGISYEMFTAGKYKRTITPYTKVEEEDRDKVEKDLEKTHMLFIEHIKKHRNIKDIEKIANGDVWYGSEALNIGLIDDVANSWEYLSEFSKSSKVFLVKNNPPRKIKDKMSDVFSMSITKSYMAISKISVENKNSKF